MLNRAQISLITNGNNLPAYQIAIKKGEISIHNITKKGETALFNAEFEKAKYLLSKGIYVNQLNNLGNLALIEYIDKKSNIYYSEEKKQMINLFFEYGLNTTLYINNLKKFIKNSDDEEYEILEKFDLLNYLSTDNLKKAYNENRELFKNHIGKTAYHEMSPLFHADKKGKEFLLSIGLNANAVNAHGENAAFYVKNEKELDLLIHSGLIINSSTLNRFNENFYYNICRNLLHSLSKKEKECTYPTIIKIINYIKTNLPQVNLLDFNDYTPDVRKEPYGLELLIDAGYFEYAKNKFPENYNKSLPKVILGLINNKKLEKIMKYLDPSMFENLTTNNKKIFQVLLLNSPYNFIKALPYMNNYPEGEDAFLLLSKFTTAYYNNTCKIKITPKEFNIFFDYIKINIDFSGDKTKNALLENIIDSTLSNGKILSIIEKELKIDLKRELREYSSNYLLGKTTPKNIDYFYNAGVDYFKDTESIEIIRTRKDMHFILEFITKKEKEILTKKLNNNNNLNSNINKKRI